MIHSHLAKLFHALVFLAIANMAIAKPDPPNIVLVLADDQGWADTSVQMAPDRRDSRSDYHQTPRLEQFAADGMRFTDAYAPAPVCAPTRYSIQFGQSPSRLRMLGNLDKFHTTARVEGKASVAQLIKQADSRYVTAHLGKWHLDATTPAALGYDVSDGPTINYNGDAGRTIWWEDGKWLRDKSKPIPSLHSDPKHTFSLTNRSIEFMQTQTDAKRPFFLQVSYYAAHTTNQALPQTLAKYEARPRGMYHQCAIYAAMSEDLDTGFGRLLDAIDEISIRNSTYVFYLSDNGGTNRRREPDGTGYTDVPVNHPLRGHKKQLWEGGIRVPLIVRGPGVEAGSYCRSPVVGWDLIPTFLEVVDHRAERRQQFEGESLLPLLKGVKGADSVFRGRSIAFHYHDDKGGRFAAYKEGDLKLVCDMVSGEHQLFDLGDDIEEQQPLSTSERPSREHTHMMAKLNSYLEQASGHGIPE